MRLASRLGDFLRSLFKVTGTLSRKQQRDLAIAVENTKVCPLRPVDPRIPVGSAGSRRDPGGIPAAAMRRRQIFVSPCLRF